MLYTVKFTQNFNGEENTTPWFGFIKPYNAVRDEETYSLTYIPTSMLNGIEFENGLPFDSIKRHKLIFRQDGMAFEQVKTHLYAVMNKKRDGLLSLSLSKNEKERDNEINIYKIHKLVNPEIILAFDDKELAEKMSNSMIYVGRMEYQIFSGDVEEMSEEEFNEIDGVETFPTNNEYAVFCGFNRWKDNQKQFVNVTRNF